MCLKFSFSLIPALFTMTLGIQSNLRSWPPLLSGQFFKIPKVFNQITVFGTSYERPISHKGPQPLSELKVDHAYH